MQHTTRIARAWLRFQSYWQKVFLALDLFGNVVFGGCFGETISSRVGLSKYRWERGVGKVLNEIEKDHVEDARMHDAQRAIEVLNILGWDTSHITAPASEQS